MFGGQNFFLSPLTMRWPQSAFVLEMMYLVTFHHEFPWKGYKYTHESPNTNSLLVRDNRWVLLGIA